MSDTGLLIKILPRGIPLAHPDEAAKSSRSPSRSDCIHLHQQLFIAVQDRRGATERAGEAGAKTTLSAARVPTRTRALPLPTHTPSPPPYMQDVKRRRQRRPRGLIGGVSRRNPRE